METTPEMEQQERREKWWKELTDAEKIERTRQQVHYLQNRLRDLQAQLEMLLNHEHGSMGRLMVPSHVARYGLEPLRIDNAKARLEGDEVYF